MKSKSFKLRATVPSIEGTFALKIVVYEHLSGGGYSGQPISSAVLSEGFGMLRMFASDLKMAGHEVTVILDDRISKFNHTMNVDYTVPILNSQEPKKFLMNLARINDASYIIAPEREKTLQSFVKLMEQTGKISLNCKSSTIQTVSDKAILYEVLKKNSLKTPETIVFNVKDSLVKVKQVINSELGYPVVFKPVDGVSCNGLSIVKKEDQVEEAIIKIKTESAEEQYIVQEFIDGEAASVSLICAKDKVSAINLNKQIVKINGPYNISSYEGGVVPFDHPLRQIALKSAKKVVECFPGLIGYVGVDLILLKDMVFIVDVNPRLTTSYIGLSKISNFNVAEAMVDGVLKNKLPTENKTEGYVCFSKLYSTKPTMTTFQELANISEIVSPPFPLNDNPKACSLIAVHDSSLRCAELKLEHSEKRVLNIISRGK